MNVAPYKLLSPDGSLIRFEKNGTWRRLELSEIPAQAKAKVRDFMGLTGDTTVTFRGAYLFWLKDEHYQWLGTDDPKVNGLYAEIEDGQADKNTT